MSGLLLSNEWSSATDRDASIAEHDHPNIDTRTFSRVTKSQLNSSKAIDKTLKHGHNHRSHCLPYSNASKSTKQPLGFNQIKKIRDETSLTAANILKMKFWNSFQKHAVSSLSDDNSYGNSSIASGASVPVLELQRAISSMTEREVSAEVQNIVQSLGFRPTESLSWKEYKNVCNRIFDPAISTNSVSISAPHSPHQYQYAHHHHYGLGESQSQASFHSEGAGSHSLSFQSIDNSSVDLQSDGLPHKSQAYSVLRRKLRGVSSIAPNRAHAEVADFSPSESTILAPVRKDALCEVLKNEYRKIRKGELPEQNRRLQDNEKGYLQQTQKNKIAALRNRSHLVPLKWRAVNEKRAAREAITQNYKDRKEMIRAFKTVVNAQERNAINREVLHKDEEAMAKIEDNSMQRYIENEITARNIKTWHKNERKIRHDLRAEYRQKMQVSVATSRQMIEEEKVFRKFMLNEGTDLESKKLSQFTSSQFEVPSDIAERIRGAKKLSAFESAKADAQVAFEHEMTRRLGLYNATRQQAIKQAEDFGCGITLHPMRGSDYFQDAAPSASISSSLSSVQSHPHLPSRRVLVSQDDPAAAKYFDSASTVTYPGQTRDSCYDKSCPPVYLDPNYDATAVYKSVSSQLYQSSPKHQHLHQQNKKEMSQSKGKSVKNTEVADGIRRYNDDIGDSVADGGDGRDEDLVSITDSIDSYNNDEDEDMNDTSF